MTKLILSAIVATLFLTTASATMARPIHDRGPVHDPEFNDLNDPNGGYAPNSPDGVRAYWDYQNRWNK
jgi:hypothetical protein